MILSKIVKPVYIKADRPICNGSLLHIDGEDYLIARNSNYSCGKHLSGVKYYCNNHIFTDEIIYKINLNTGNTEFVKFLTKSTQQDIKNHSSFGFEDVRIVNWQGKNYITMVLDKNHNCQVYKYELADDFNLINCDMFKTSNKIEKNWQPIETIPNKFIYSYKPFKILDFESKTLTDIKVNNCINYSGSSQIISINDIHNLGIIHTRNNRTYKHYFVLFDKNMKLLEISKEFSFIGIDVEFNCFIEKSNNNIRIIVGLNDSNSILFEIPINTLYDIITNKINNNDLIDEEVIETIYKNDNHLLSKLCISTYSTNKELLEDAIILNHTAKINEDFKICLQKTLLNQFGV